MLVATSKYPANNGPRFEGPSRRWKTEVLLRYLIAEATFLREHFAIGLVID